MHKLESKSRLLLSVEVLVQIKLITPECLQHYACKLLFLWGIVGVGDDVAEILRHIEGIMLKHGGESHTTT